MSHSCWQIRISFDGREKFYVLCRRLSPCTIGDVIAECGRDHGRQQRTIFTSPLSCRERSDSVCSNTFTVVFTCNGNLVLAKAIRRRRCHSVTAIGGQANVAIRCCHPDYLLLIDCSEGWGWTTCYIETYFSNVCIPVVAAFCRPITNSWRR